MNYLYGKLNKELEYVKYRGEDTSTINTTVDNENNIIKSEVIKTPKSLTINNKITGLSGVFDGSHDVEVEIPKYTLELQESSDEYLFTYDFKLNDKTLTTIKIPQDKDIVDISLHKCEEAGVPLPELKVGDPYLEIVKEDGKGSYETSYIALASNLIAGDSIKIDDNIISVDLDNGKLSEQIQKLNNHIEDKNNPHQVIYQQLARYTFNDVSVDIINKNDDTTYPFCGFIDIPDELQEEAANLMPMVYLDPTNEDNGKVASSCDIVFTPARNLMQAGDYLGVVYININEDVTSYFEQLAENMNYSIYPSIGDSPLEGIYNVIITYNYPTGSIYIKETSNMELPFLGWQIVNLPKDNINYPVFILFSGWGGLWWVSPKLLAISTDKIWGEYRKEDYDEATGWLKIIKDDFKGVVPLYEILHNSQSTSTSWIVNNVFDQDIFKHIISKDNNFEDTEEYKYKLKIISTKPINGFKLNRIELY